MHQVCILYITDDLHTLGCKMLQISRQLQCRTVDVGHLNFNLVEVNIRSF